MYSTSAVGVVVSPRAARVRCSYWTDGNSANHEPHGCHRQSYSDLHSMMTDQLKRFHGLDWGSERCVWGQASARDRSGCQYNEVVLEGAAWETRLPLTIEAVFYPVDGNVDHWERVTGEANALHADFTQRHAAAAAAATAGGAAPFPPLLTFSVAEARAGRAPFAVAPAGGDGTMAPRGSATPTAWECLVNPSAARCAR